MQIYILDGTAVAKLADQYALYLTESDKILLMSPTNVVHYMEDMEDMYEVHDGSIMVEPAYLYHLRGDFVDYTNDIWNSVLDTVDELRDMFVGLTVAPEDGSLYFDLNTQTMKGRVEGRWIPIQDNMP